MEKKRYKISFIIFLIIFVAGLVATFIPKAPQKLFFSNISTNYINKTGSYYNYKISFTITNNDVKLENCNLDIKYEKDSSFSGESYAYKTLNGITLDVGETELSFILQDRYSIHVDEFEYITISASGVQITAYSQDYININIYCLGLTIIGLFGLVSSLIAWKVKPKYNKIGQAREVLEQNIKTIFSQTPPFNTRAQNEDQTTQTLHDEKNVCPYCNAYYSKKYDKCPHCGAPPERKD